MPANARSRARAAAIGHTRIAPPPPPTAPETAPEACRAVSLPTERRERAFFFCTHQFEHRTRSPPPPSPRPPHAPTPITRVPLNQPATNQQPTSPNNKPTTTTNSSASASARRPAAAPIAARRPAVVVRAEGGDRKPSSSFASSLAKVELPKVEVPTSDEINAKLSQTGAQIAEAWDKTEDKPTAVFFAAVALVALVAASSVVSTVESIPIVGDGIKLVGVGATAFFSYKYLVWPQDREQLVKDVKSLFSKIGL